MRIITLILSGVIFCALGLQAQNSTSSDVKVKSNGNKLKITGTYNIENEEEFDKFIDSIVSLTENSIKKVQFELDNLNLKELDLNSLDSVLNQITIKIRNTDTRISKPVGKILLGIMIDEFMPSEENQKGHPTISNVIVESPAEEAGLKINDIVYKMDGEEIFQTADVINTVKNKTEGDSIIIEYIRHQDTIQTVAHLRLVTDENWLSLLNKNITKIDSAVQTMTPFCEKIIIQKSGPRLGVNVMDLNEEARKSLKAKKGGALITNVIEYTAAQQMLLQVNDVIIEFNGRPIQNVAELKHLVDNLSVPNDVTIKYIRYGKKKSTKGTISEFSKAWDENSQMNVIDLSQFFQE